MLILSRTIQFGFDVKNQPRTIRLNIMCVEVTRTISFCRTFQKTGQLWKKTRERVPCTSTFYFSMSQHTKSSLHRFQAHSSPHNWSTSTTPARSTRSTRESLSVNSLLAPDHIMMTEPPPSPFGDRTNRAQTDECTIGVKGSSRGHPPWLR